MLTQPIMNYALIYYGIGLLWMASGVFLGWLKIRGDDPALAILWMAARAAIWPILAIRIIRDLLNGRGFTHIE